MVTTKVQMRNVLVVVLSLFYSVFSLPSVRHPSLHTGGQPSLPVLRWGNGVPAPTNLIGPQVQLAQGLITGLSMSQFGQDYFLGIPYAQPPLGGLRFAKPQPPKLNTTHKIDATRYGKACLQPTSTTGITTTSFSTTTGLTTSDLSEDCLFINIFRPSNLAHGSKLPVMVWIHGGAFTLGASQLYNGSVIVGQSVFLNESVIYISFNYRLNAFGFLGSPELGHDSEVGALNAGLHDMIGALKWVQENIGAFGGDKDRVTVFGESAGAIGIGSLLVAGGGHYVEQHNLFHGAIMESGAPASLFHPIPVPVVSDLLPWTNIFAGAAGCPPSNSPIISCLRSKPSEILYQASLVALNATKYALAFPRVVDGFFFDKGKRAAEQVRRGDVATVPVIAGCNLDEGTLFVPHTFNTTNEMVNYFRELLYVGNLSAATPEQTKLFKVLLKLYPDIPAIGSPYNPVGASKDDRFFGQNNQYKRAASLFGDGAYQSGRRALLDTYVKRNVDYPAWTYLYTQVIPDTPAYLGVYHGSEAPSVFGLYAAQNKTSVPGMTSLYMVSSWVAFANSLHPNRPYLPNWPKYGKRGHMLNIGNGNFDVITDDFRKKGMEFLQRKEFTDTFNL